MPEARHEQIAGGKRSQSIHTVPHCSGSERPLGSIEGCQRGSFSVDGGAHWWRTALRRAAVSWAAGLSFDGAKSGFGCIPRMSPWFPSTTLLPPV